MRKLSSFFSVVAALALGAAGAQSSTTPSTAVTPAGTEIINKAEITFTPEPTPTNPNPPSETVETPPVVTVVNPVPSFTITPNDGSADPTQPDYTQPGQTKEVKPCDKNVTFAYTLINTGNVNGESYTLTNTPDPTGAVKTPENVRFYRDTNGNGQLEQAEIDAGTITTITGVAIGQSVQFFQVYDVPCTATSTDKFGGDPTGTRNDNPNFSNDPTLPRDANNSNTVTVNRQDGVVIGPKADPDGNGNPVTPAYTSPEGVAISPTANDSQIATVTTLPASGITVTFTNTLQNTGNRTDTFELTQTNTFPAGSTITFRDANGNPLPDADGDGNPEVPNVPAGQTADIQVIVTLPAGVTPTQLAGQPAVVITTTSQNDPSKSDKTTDIIHVKVPGLSFGDPTPTPGGDPAPVGTPPAGVPGNPGTPLVPGNPETCTAPIRTYLPMEIANLGSQDDAFVVSGTAPVTVLNPDGTVNPTPVIVPVVYYRDVNGDGRLDAGDTALQGGNTGTIKPGEEIKLIAVVDVPCAAAKQTITLNQEAKSPTTGVSVKDPNDTITVGDNGGKPTVTKTVDKPTANPGETLTYTIVGKNSSNANVTKALVCDTVPTNTTFVSFTATTTASGTVVYSNDGGTNWSATATAPAAGAKVCAAVDTNSDGTITTADLLKPGESINVTYQVKVN
ncbi:DUF11 domain-containing protein [Deinococcus wulumuqiensis]|uniref:DUF11 domain-containing protein n=1 Tax=Deinococcus wulumuqiensis TaxID=980427 RepID=A0A345IHC2_9DEIO|nr:DUF11 domain-containing protein [Deinococcus wulumuqiensis]AXG99094.1 DUF11 domain-containing protein [Deinococcus wulumuqiensis]